MVHACADVAENLKGRAVNELDVVRLKNLNG